MTTKQGECNADAMRVAAPLGFAPTGDLYSEDHARSQPREPLRGRAVAGLELDGAAVGRGGGEARALAGLGVHQRAVGLLDPLLGAGAVAGVDPDRRAGRGRAAGDVDAVVVVG